MGIGTGLFKNSTKFYSITLVGSDITDGTFEIVGDVALQTGSQTRSVSDIFNPIRSSQLRFTARNSQTLFDELALTKLGAVTVTLNNLTDSTVEFIGYVQPQNIEKNQKWDAGAYVLTCFDGLTLLKQKTYTLNATYTLAAFFEAILEQLTIVTKVLYVASWQDTNMATTSPALIRFDSSIIDAETDYEALEIILKRFGLIISQARRGTTVEWKIIQRKQIGGDNSGWLIDFSDSSVASQTQTDSDTLADANLISEPIKGKTDSVEKINTTFAWNIDDPFILNSSFKQFNGTSLASWVTQSGTLDLPSAGDGNIESDDNAVIVQRLNYVKAAGQPFQIDFNFNATGAATSDVIRTFNFAKVSFIDPLADKDTLYLLNDGSVSTTDTELSYSRGVNSGRNNAEEISIILDTTATAYTDNRIVVVELYFFKADITLVNRYTKVNWNSIKSNLEATDNPNALLTQIDPNEFGGVIENQFNLGDQTLYNAKGGIEVNNGSAWVLSTDWGTSENIDTVFTRDINRQSKNPLEYFKVKTIPSVFTKRSFTNAFTYKSKIFIPIYQLVNYTSSSIDFQLIEKSNVSPSSVTETLLSDNENAGFATIPIDPLQNVTVVEISGEAQINYLKGREASIVVLISFRDLVVLLSNGQTKEPANKSVDLPLSFTSPFLVPVTFFYNIFANVVDFKLRTEWLSTAAFRDETKYAKLFDLTSNGSIVVDGSTEQSAPIAVPQIEPIAKALFSVPEADSEAALNEVIWDYRSDFICKIASDLDGDYTSIAIDPQFPVRVTIPSGSDLKIQSGNRTYQVTTTALVQTGELSIPIQQAYIVAYKTAVVKYDVAFDGSQVLVQPSQVLVIAQNATGDASAALSLIAGQGTALASLSAEVLGADGTSNTAGIKFDVTQIATRAVLQVDTAGNIASISLLSGVTDSSVKINADQIDVNGETTFFAGITRAISDGEITVPDGVSTFFQETAPTGSDYLVGDLWFDTSDDNSGMPHRWNDTIWAQAFVTINGGLITADSITANSILIGDLFSKNISITGTLKAQQEDNASNFVQLSVDGILAQQGGVTKFSIPLVGDPTFSGTITETVYNLQSSSIRTSPTVQTDGGLIVDQLGLRAYDSDGEKTVDIAANGAASFAGNIEALTGNLGNLNVTGNLALNGGKIIFGSTLEISSTQIKFGDTSISNIGLVSGDTRVFNGGMLIGSTTQFGFGECNLSTDIVNTVRLSNTSGALAIQSTNTIKINGTTCVASYTGNPTSITVNNGLITAIS